MGLEDLIDGKISEESILRDLNATVTYDKLPHGINGLVFSYKGYYVIILNKYLSMKNKKKTILHEIAHIKLNQLDYPKKELIAFKRNDYEDEADKYLNFVMKERL